MPNHPLLKNFRALGFGLGLVFCLLASSTALPAEEKKKPVSAEAAEKGDDALPLAAEAGRNSGTNGTPTLTPSSRSFDQDQAEEAVAEAVAENIRRIKFLQRNFAKFVPVTFQKGTNSKAALQHLNFATNKFQYAGDGKYYFGFQFTAPEWIDGNFVWCFNLDKSEAQKDFYSDKFRWDIFPEHGLSEGFSDYEQFMLSDFKELSRRFPYSKMLTIQSLPQKRLEPGKKYAIWFSVLTKDHPDVVFAMTIKSAQGQREFGELPLH